MAFLRITASPADDAYVPWMGRRVTCRCLPSGFVQLAEPDIFMIQRISLTTRGASSPGDARASLAALSVSMRGVA
jgi:hypothetical protein